MAEIKDWATAAASNNDTPPNGAPEGMAPSAVNDVIRENMAVLARWKGDNDGSLDTAGSSNTYTLTTNGTYTAYARGETFTVEANHTNTGAATINVSSLGAKSITYTSGDALIGGEIVAGGVYLLFYDGTSFQLLNPSIDPSTAYFDRANGRVGISTTSPETALDLGTGTAKAALFRTFTGTTSSLAASASETIFTGADPGHYIVSVVAADGNADWRAIYVVASGVDTGDAVRVTSLQNNDVTVSWAASGQNVQVTNTGGSAQSFNWTALRVL